MNAEERQVLTVSRGLIVSHQCLDHGWVKPRVVFIDMKNPAGQWQKVGSVVCSRCKKVEVRGKKIQVTPGLRSVYTLKAGAR